MNTQMETTDVKVTLQFSATAERVYDAWLDRRRIGRWMFGPALREEEVLRIDVDARVNGRFSFLVRRDGQEIDHVGTYLEWDRPRRLVFTWAIKDGSDDDVSQVTVDIVPQGSGCELTLVHRMDAKWAEFAESARGSWAKMVGALASQLN
jgi:uncharacterized protein YndB with AHSA1/START domain